MTKSITTFAFAMISRTINGFELGDLKVRKRRKWNICNLFFVNSCLWWRFKRRGVLLLKGLKLKSAILIKSSEGISDAVKTVSEF